MARVTPICQVGCDRWPWQPESPAIWKIGHRACYEMCREVQYLSRVKNKHCTNAVPQALQGDFKACVS